MTALDGTTKKKCEKLLKVAELLSKRSQLTQRKSLVLRRAPCRNRTPNPVIKSHGVLRSPSHTFKFETILPKGV